jgi:hypothetical protein
LDAFADAMTPAALRDELREDEIASDAA